MEEPGKVKQILLLTSKTSTLVVSRSDTDPMTAPSSRNAALEQPATHDILSMDGISSGPFRRRSNCLGGLDSTEESSKLVDTHISSQLLLEEIEYQYQEDNLNVSGQNLTSPGELVQDQIAKSGQPAEKQDACGGLHNSTTFADVNLPSNGLGWSRNEVNKRSTAGGYCSLDSDQSMRISPAGRQHPSLVSQGSSLSATERAKDEERRIREKLKMGAQQAKNRDRRLRHSISRASDLLHRKATQKFVQPLPSTLENKYDTCRNNKYTSL